MVALSEQDRAWWIRRDGEREEEDIRAHEKLSAVIKAVTDTQDARRRGCMVWASMYGADQTLAALLGMGSKMSAAQTGPRAETGLSLNVTRNVIDAVVSRVFSKTRPHLTFASKGGGYEKQHAAEQLELGTDGVFYRTKAYKQFTEAGRNGCIFGDGDVRIEADMDTREVTVCPLLPMQLIVDEETDLYEGQPRSWYLLTPIDKYVLAYQYREQPDKADRIEMLAADKSGNDNYGFQQRGLSVYLYEGWHRPSGREAGDGRYVKGVANVTLEDRPWDGGRNGRPNIASFQWSPSVGGYYGQGIAEQGRGIQSEINALVRQIQNGHHLITGRWLIEGNSKVIASHINNDLSSLLRYTGTKPEYFAPAIIAPEMYQHLWNLVQKYYELSGVNQQAAQAQKPVGVTSGEAQRVYAEQQTETLLEKGTRFEDFVKECGQLCVDAAKLLAEKGAYEVHAAADDGFETIDWKDVEDPDGFECTVEATNSLPGTVAGKLELGNDLLKLGEFDSADLFEIIGLPDMLQKQKLKLSSRRLVEKKVGEMLREGKPWAPTPTINKDEAFAIARDMVNMAEAKDPPPPEEHLQMVRDFMVALVDLRTLELPQPAAPAMAPGAPGLMAPGMPGAAGPAAPAAQPLNAIPHPPAQAA